MTITLGVQEISLLITVLSLLIGSWWFLFKKINEVKSEIMVLRLEVTSNYVRAAEMKEVEIRLSKAMTKLEESIDKFSDKLEELIKMVYSK